MTSATGNRGFTLLEMLIALTIMILLVAAWPATFSHFFPRQRLKIATRTAFDMIAAVRTSARAHGAPQEITVNPAGLTSGVANYAADWPTDMTFAYQDRSGKSTLQLWVYPDGSSTGGQLTLRYRAREETLLLGAVTGHTEVAQ